MLAKASACFLKRAGRPVLHCWHAGELPGTATLALCMRGGPGLVQAPLSVLGSDFSLNAQQAVRDVSVPEVPTFLPAWAHLSAEQVHAAGEEVVEHMAPRERVNAAAQAIPGTGSGHAAETDAPTLWCSGSQVHLVSGVLKLNLLPGRRPPATGCAEGQWPVSAFCVRSAAALTC